MQEIVIIDPYNWWPDSRFMFNTSSNYSVITNYNSISERKVKKFEATSKITKLIEVVYKLPKVLFENRKKNIILMWNVVPVYCLLLVWIFHFFGCNTAFWMHNTIPHRTAKIARRLVPIIWFLLPFFIPIISMNKRYIHFEFDLVRKLKWICRFKIHRCSGIVFAKTVYLGFIVRRVTFVPHGCSPQRLNNASKDKHHKIYDVGIFGRIQNYKYDKLFWKQLLEFTQFTGSKVVICGRGCIPQEVVDDPNIFIRNEWVSDNEINDLMQKTKLILIKHQYIDASGIIIKCIENTTMFLSTYVGGNTKFFRFKRHFVELDYNIFYQAEKILSEYISTEREFILDCEIYYKLFNYEKLGISFSHSAGLSTGGIV